MSIISMKSTSRNSSVGTKSRTHTVVFAVRSNVKDEDNYLLAAQASVFIGVTINTPYGTDPLAYCNSITSSHKENTTEGSLWDCTFVFGTVENPEKEEFKNPLDRAAVENWSTEFREVVVDYDRSNPQKAIVNAAKDQFSNSPTRLQALPKLSIQRNEATFTPLTLMNYVDKVSSDVFRGAAAGRCLCQSITASQQTETIGEDEFQFWSLSYEFLFSFHEPYFDERILNAGLREIASGATTATAILSKGIEITTEMPLSTTGVALHGSQEPNFIDFKMHDSISFGSLAL